MTLYDAESGNLTLVASGDTMITRRLSVFKEERFLSLVDLFRDAVALSRRFKLSYRDGAILAAARAAGCDAVYSEDLSARQDYDGVRVIDPFEARSSSP